METLPSDPRARRLWVDGNEGSDCSYTGIDVEVDAAKTDAEADVDADSDAVTVAVEDSDAAADVDGPSEAPLFAGVDAPSRFFGVQELEHLKQL